MGLGSHEKKIEAMQPLTSDFHILASIKCPVKHQPVDHWDQDFAPRVQMGLGLHEKKMEGCASLNRISVSIFSHKFYESVDLVRPRQP